MGTKPVTEKTFLEYRFVSAPRFSPDGNQIAYIVATADWEANRYKGDLYIYENGRTKQLTAGGDARGYCWTEEGTLLFPAARDPKLKEAAEKGEHTTVYYEIDPHGGEAHEAFRLAYDASGLTRLSNGLYLFQAETNIGEEPEKDAPCDVIDELPFWWNGTSFISRKRDMLYLYDRTAGKATCITNENESLMAVSADCGGKLLFVAAENEGVRPLYGNLYAYDIASGERKLLLSADKLQIESAMYLDGRVVVLGATGSTYGSNETPVYWLLGADGLPKPFAADPLGGGDGHLNSDTRLGGGQGALEGDKAYHYLVIDSSVTLLKRLNADGSIETVYAPGNAIDTFDICNGHIVTCEMSGNDLAELYLDGEKITSENTAILSTLALSTPEKCDFVNDGVAMQGWIMKPAGFDPQKRYPAILHIHGGPRTAFGECLHNEQQLWASKGYFVFFCNPRGSDGRGDAFADIWGKYGTIDYEDLMAFTDTCLARCPQVDPDRVGVTGGSYGGYMTNWIIGHTDRFRCAASQRSIANWISFEHTTDIGYFFNLSQHNANTASDPEALWNASPLKYAKNAVTPTLFIHSDHDYRCWMAEGLQMYSALKMKGVDTRLCLFRDETHELSRSGKPKSRVRRMEEIVRWMDKYLQTEG